MPAASNEKPSDIRIEFLKRRIGQMEGTIDHTKPGQANHKRTLFSFRPVLIESATMLRRLLNRFSLIQATLLTSAVSIAISLGITMAGMAWLGKTQIVFAAALAVICPMVIATPAAYVFLRLLVEVEAKRNALEEANRRLEIALRDVRELSGMLPICSSCKKIRDDEGYWSQIETYIMKHTKADFTHGLCPDCAIELYPTLNLKGMSY